MATKADAATPYAPPAATQLPNSTSAAMDIVYNTSNNTLTDGQGNSLWTLSLKRETTPVWRLTITPNPLKDAPSGSSAVITYAAIHNSHPNTLLTQTTAVIDADGTATLSPATHTEELDALLGMDTATPITPPRALTLQSEFSVAVTTPPDANGEQVTTVYTSPTVPTIYTPNIASNATDATPIAAATLKAGEVTTLAPDQEATAAIVYKDGAYFLSLGVPQGQQGQQGEQGPQGPEGAKGDTGDTGPQGPQGIQGERGEKGEKGDKGDQGEPGPQGEQGAKGDTGATGPQGPQGEQGPQGDPGTGTTTTIADANSNGVSLLSTNTVDADGNRYTTLRKILAGDNMTVTPTADGNAVTLSSSGGGETIEISNCLFLAPGDNWHYINTLSNGYKESWPLINGDTRCCHKFFASPLVAGPGVVLSNSTYVCSNTGQQWEAVEIASPLVAGPGVVLNDTFKSIGGKCYQAVEIASNLVAGPGVVLSNIETGKECEGTCNERIIYSPKIFACLTGGDGITVSPVTCKDGVTRIRISLA
jgi:hypothetical protein